MWYYMHNLMTLIDDRAKKSMHKLKVCLNRLCMNRDKFSEKRMTVHRTQEFMNKLIICIKRLGINRYSTVLENISGAIPL